MGPAGWRRRKSISSVSGNRSATEATSSLPRSSSAVICPRSSVIPYNQSVLGKVFGGLEEYAPLLIRLALAATFIQSGAGKIFGIWGGHGLEKTAEFFGPGKL